MGRPSKRTPERVEKLLQALKDGNTRGAACAVAGISAETFSQWQKEYPEFTESVKKAEDEAEAAYVEQIKLASRPRIVRTTKTVVKPDGATETTETESQEFNWQAAAWWLERRRNADYGMKQTVVVQVQKAIAELLDYVEEQDADLYERLSGLLEQRGQTTPTHQA